MFYSGDTLGDVHEWMLPTSSAELCRESTLPAPEEFSLEHHTKLSSARAVLGIVRHEESRRVFSAHANGYVVDHSRSGAVSDRCYEFPFSIANDRALAIRGGCLVVVGSKGDLGVAQLDQINSVDVHQGILLPQERIATPHSRMMNDLKNVTLEAIEFAAEHTDGSNTFGIFTGGKGHNVRYLANDVVEWSASQKVPVHITAIAQLPSQNGNGRVVAATTAKKSILVYDTRSDGDKPQCELNLDTLRGRPSRICALSEHTVLIGDTFGDVAIYDIRRSDRSCLGRLKCGRGAVNSLCVLPGTNFAASVCRDRFVRVHNLNLPVHELSGNLVTERVMKTTPTCVIAGEMGADVTKALIKNIKGKDQALTTAGKPATAVPTMRGDDRFSNAPTMLTEAESKEMWASLDVVTGNTVVIPSPKPGAKFPIRQRRGLWFAPRAR
eukprot:PhM_4_TR13090/c0_g1_i1/m.5722